MQAIIRPKYLKIIKLIKYKMLVFDEVHILFHFNWVLAF